MYCIVLFCIVLYCIVLYFSVCIVCIALYCIVLFCIVLYCIVLFCIVLYCILVYVLYCIVCMYCIVLMISKCEAFSYRDIRYKCISYIIYNNNIIYFHKSRIFLEVWTRCKSLFIHLLKRNVGISSVRLVCS